ncbi:ribonuclease Z [Flavobacterium restrictum]|uniref:Ribonuclease Z n=1 Tax=Flavobacterium restrictum TaxID=2594428 RepID=A0A553DXJ8_9FLAO|nr:ribonuclease Z [Flavobacterium restrictum]TRX37509.1 ribonuclease Z [Flavobacterium restrictum]
MKVDTKGHTITIKDTESSIEDFLIKVTTQYNSFKSHNLILDISHDKTVETSTIKQFDELSKKHKKSKKSFVLVAANIDFNAVPTAILVVPSLLEAHDIIEMEEIERDLGF